MNTFGFTCSSCFTEGDPWILWEILQFLLKRLTVWSLMSRKWNDWTERILGFLGSIGSLMSEKRELRLKTITNRTELTYLLQFKKKKWVNKSHAYKQNWYFNIFLKSNKTINKKYSKHSTIVSIFVQKTLATECLMIAYENVFKLTKSTRTENEFEWLQCYLCGVFRFEH